MKVTLRIPMRESFAYIEVEAEVKSIEEAIDAYLKAQVLLKEKTQVTNNNDF